MKMDHPADVLLMPILSEESTIQSQAKNKFTFRVHSGANKRQIKEAIEEQFNVHVTSVNTMNYLGKMSGRRGRMAPGRKSSWKKAIVTIQQGQTIDLI